MKQMFVGATGAVAAFDPATLLDGKAVSVANRDGQVYRTPSGKLEFYSETLAKQGLPPLPDWRPDPAHAGSGPLRLLTTPGISKVTLPSPATRFCANVRACRTPFCIRSTRSPRPDGRPACAPAQRARRGRVVVAACATKSNPASCWCPASGRTAKPPAARSTCCAPTVTPTWERARPIKAPGSRSAR